MFREYPLEIDALGVSRAVISVPSYRAGSAGRLFFLILVRTHGAILAYTINARADLPLGAGAAECSPRSACSATGLARFARWCLIIVVLITAATASTIIASVLTYSAFLARCLARLVQVHVPTGPAGQA